VGGGGGGGADPKALVGGESVDVTRVHHIGCWWMQHMCIISDAEWCTPASSNQFLLTKFHREIKGGGILSVNKCNVIR
jgi:G:T-mismatch repair DNA endonuclease (very short patch repair protein)